MDYHLSVQAQLEELYMEVEEFDIIQEQILDICVKLNKLDNEEQLYINLDMPEFFTATLKCIHIERSILLKRKNKLEDSISMVDLEEILSAIESCEKTLTSRM